MEKVIFLAGDALHTHKFRPERRAPEIGKRSSPNMKQDAFGGK